MTVLNSFYVILEEQLALIHGEDSGQLILGGEEAAAAAAAVGRSESPRPSHHYALHGQEEREGMR